MQKPTEFLNIYIENKLCFFTKIAIKTANFDSQKI